MLEKRTSWQTFIMTQSLFLSWVIALIATLGSLYFSEVVGYIPCDLCWYQRIFMYPLVFLLTVAYIRKENQMSIYILPLSIIGLCISLFHYGKQKEWFGTLPDGCTIVPCTTTYINWFGFITIPFLAFIAFLIITILNLFLWKYVRKGV